MGLLISGSGVRAPLVVFFCSFCSPRPLYARHARPGPFTNANCCALRKGCKILGEMGMETSLCAVPPSSHHFTGPERAASYALAGRLSQLWRHCVGCALPVGACRVRCADPPLVLRSASLACGRDIWLPEFSGFWSGSGVQALENHRHAYFEPH